MWVVWNILTLLAAFALCYLGVGLMVTIMFAFLAIHPKYRRIIKNPFNPYFIVECLLFWWLMLWTFNDFLKRIKAKESG